VKLTILGGGGFRVPLVHGALLRETAERRVRRVVLHDVDADRLAVIADVLRDQAVHLQRNGIEPPQLHITTDLRDALVEADFVFSAIRVGGAQDRVADERVALDAGLLGQETTGPGGIAYGLRTVPVAVRIAELIAEVAPQAWVINFTNPAGLITQAMQQVLGRRVIGICDSPLGLANRAARALGRELSELTVDYAGLNHLGWLNSLRTPAGDDLLPQLLTDATALLSIEEGALFGPDWLRDLGAMPNEYLYYYYFTRDAIEQIRAAEHSRGEYLVAQQDRFYSGAGSWQRWDAVRQQRNATYMQETRTEHGDERHEQDVEGGGYEGVALALMAALSRDEPARLILNVRNGFALPGLPEDAVVEVPCRVDASGPEPEAVTPLRGHQLGLVQQVKAVDELVIEAALSGSPERAVQAFALHPLVDSVNVARALLSGYRARIPTLDAVFQA